MKTSSNSPKPVILMRFGGAVRARRLALGLSQEELATVCDLDRSYVGGVERGERNVSLVNIQTIATALRLTIAELMRLSEAAGRNEPIR